MNVEPFEYMAWAKRLRDGPPPPFALHESGMPRPSGELLGAPPPLAGPADVPALQARVAAHVGGGVRPEDVLLTHGASEALATVCAGVVHAGQTALAETPCYPALANVPRLFGAERRVLPRRRVNDWRLDPDDVDERLVPGVGLVLVSHDHNPTGAPLGEEGWARLVARAAEVDATVVVDEVYRDFAFDRDDAAPPACLAAPHVVTVSSLTKAWGLGELRLGWAVVTDEERAARLREAHDYLSVNVSGAAVAWALALWERRAAFAARIERIEREHHPVVDAWLASEPLADARVPPRGLIVFPRLLRPNGTPVDTAGLCRRLLEERGVSLVPGEVFGRAGHVRLGMGAPPERLERACAMISEALREEA